MAEDDGTARRQRAVASQALAAGAAPAVDRLERAPQGPAVATRRPRILVADDDASQRISMSLVLKHRGFEVDCALDGAEAVRLAGSRRYDGVLLDVRMPVLDGLEALGAIRRCSGARVVLLTGYASEDVVQRAEAAGAAAVLHKPADPELVIAALGLLVADRDSGR